MQTMQRQGLEAIYYCERSCISTREEKTKHAAAQWSPATAAGEGQRDEHI